MSSSIIPCMYELVNNNVYAVSTSIYNSLINDHFKNDSVFIVENNPLQLFSCVKNTPELYKCDTCGLQVYLKVNLKVHNETTHRTGNEIPVENFLQYSDTNFNLTNILKCYSCERCHFNTFSLLVFLKHELKQVCHSKIVETVRPRNSSYDRNFPRKKIDLYECEECEFKTKVKQTMVNHIDAKHTSFDKMKWLKCRQCPFKTIYKRTLQIHKLTEHTDKWFQCSSCSYKSKIKNHLEMHVLAKHTAVENIKWFHCDQCTYKAKSKWTLKGHTIARHTADKDINWFLCELCAYKCKRRTHLKQHMKGKHKIEFYLS